jgi:hypothetical protein
MQGDNKEQERHYFSHKQDWFCISEKAILKFILKAAH